jgi:hypothetical protein
LDIIDAGQLLFWTVTAIGGLVAAWKAIREMRESRLQRDREFNWKQAVAGKDLIEDFYKDTRSFIAMQLLDWSGRAYKCGSTTFVITYRDVISALRIDNLSFNAKETFIRDCFDAYFLRLERIQSAIEIHLTAKEFVKDCDYYIAIMRQDPAVFSGFADDNGYSKVAKLCNEKPAEKAQGWIRCEVMPEEAAAILTSLDRGYKLAPA